VNGSFDMIIMDLNMPIMDGFRATKKIKEFYKISNVFVGGGLFTEDLAGSSLKQVPVIVALSSEIFDENLSSRCREAGFDFWFSSPLNSSLLYQQVIDPLLVRLNLLASDCQICRSPRYAQVGFN